MQWTTSYPLGELIACIGFFLVFLMEETVLALIPGIGHRGHSHGRKQQLPIITQSQTAPQFPVNGTIEANHKEEQIITFDESKVLLKITNDVHTE
jgi:hypothetical protein